MGEREKEDGGKVKGRVGEGGGRDSKGVDR